MYALFVKEISSFFHSLSGYVVIIVFLTVNSLFLWVFEGNLNIPRGGYATLEGLFIIAPWIFLILVPAVTMRSFAEEKKSGTLDLLLIRPLTGFQIIMAKYLASLMLILLSLLPTLVYYYSVIKLGSPQGNIDHGGTWGSYIGLFLLAASYAGIGIWCSTLTDNLIISFLLSAVVCMILCYGPEQISAMITSGRQGSFLQSLGIIEHYRSISRGVVDTRDLVYFISLTAIFLLFAKSRLQYGRV